MSGLGYAASIATQWKDFTPQHERKRQQALSIALGNSPVPAGAVVGVYGSGKSTLLFDVLARVGQEGVFPVWEEARAFLDRLLPSTEKISPQDFVVRVHKWVGDLRADPSIFARYKNDLESRQLGEVAKAAEAALLLPTDRSVLLLDEMEQAYPHFLQRIETPDHQPLRALIDSCQSSTVKLLMAYAPESFLALGDADRGRMARIAVPSLTATSIQRFFQLQKRHSNFAWWASRGRARGVIKVVNEVIQPYLSGEYESSWLGLAEALDALPSVFGVPAVLRDSVPAGRVKDLLDLAPHRESESPGSHLISLQDRPSLGQRMMEKLALRSPAKREDIEVIVDELLDILDAISDQDERCALTFEDFTAGVKLATARAIESGRMAEFPEGINAGQAFFEIAKQTDEGWVLPFSLTQLSDDIFPSPFTEPVLPLKGGRIPAQDDVDRLYTEQGPEQVVFQWKERNCFIMRDSKALGEWLTQVLPGSDENSRWRVLLLDDAGEEPGLLALAREAGRIEVRRLERFHACFIKCLYIRARQEQLGGELEIVASTIRAQDRQLGRKVDWHLSRIGRLVDEMDPTPTQRWVGAVTASRERLRGPLNRLGEDAPGVLALLYPLKRCQPETRKMLGELAEILGVGSELRTLAKSIEGRKRLEGAGVVVDELLPVARSGPTRRWVEGEFPGRSELTEILDRFAPSEEATIIAKLLNPHEAARMEPLVRFHSGKLPDLKPERLQLDALQGINAVVQRAKSIHKGIQSLLGIKTEVPGLVIGKVIGKALTAQKSFQAFNRLTERLERIEEPWAKALALWVGAVFAERIWAGVEGDEAQLRSWEAISEEGKELARATEGRLEMLEDLGFTGVSEFIAAERGRMKAGLSDPEQMQIKLQELRGTLDAEAELTGTLAKLKELASDRGTEISELLRTYRPEAGRISEESGAAEQILTMLSDIQDDWPVPGAEDLRSYLQRLEQFGRQSHADRLRSRLSQAIQTPLTLKEIVPDPDDVTRVEEDWPKLGEEFAQSCRNAIETAPQTGSDRLVLWITEAVEKQTMLSKMLPDPNLHSIDEKTRAWATRVTTRPAHLSEAINSRARTHQFLTNLSRSVAPSVIEELAKAGGNALPEQAQTTLEGEARKFHEGVEERASRLNGVTGTAKRPFSGTTRAAVLNELEVAARAAEDKRDQFHQRVIALNRVIVSLGGRAISVPSPLTAPVAESLATAASDGARELLNRVWLDVSGRLDKLGIDIALLQRDRARNEEEDLASFQSAKSWCDAVEQEAQALLEMGLPVPTEGIGTREETMEGIRSAVATGRRDLQGLNERFRVARLRLLRMGGAETAAEIGEFKTIGKAQDALARLKEDSETVRAKLLSGASIPAQEVYTALVSGTTSRGAEIEPVIELRRLGLLRTIEDDL